MAVQGTLGVCVVLQRPLVKCIWEFCFAKASLPSLGPGYPSKIAVSPLVPTKRYGSSRLAGWGPS